LKNILLILNITHSMGFLQEIIDKEAPEVIEKRNKAARSRILASVVLVLVITGISFVVDAVESED